MSTTTKYNRIKVELTEAGKSSEELALHLDVHKTTVSDWCTNKNQPSVQKLYLIAAFLNIDVRKLLVPNKPNTSTIDFAQEEQPLRMVAEEKQPYARKPKTTRPPSKRKPK